MGVETFGVSLKFESEKFGDIHDCLISHSGLSKIKSDTSSPDGWQYIYEDSKHIVECQLTRDGGVCDCSIRFSLCSFESIDEVFIEVVTSVVELHPSVIWLMSSVNHTHDRFDGEDSDLLLKMLPGEIGDMRKHWQKMFGTKQGKVLVAGSYQFIGIA